MEFDQAQLEALSACVAEGTFEAAARRLYVTPSAVSQRIKALETSVGQVLLSRSKPVRPTSSGQTLLRIARQMQALTAEAARELRIEPAARGTVISVAVNADSLGTWFLPALAAAGPSYAFDLYRSDQEQTAGLLRDGTVMAAVTAQAAAVPGCTAERLGTMRYRPRASPGFAATWFPDGTSVAALARAPVVCFDRQDRLQERYLRHRSRRRLDPPCHYVPGSADFTHAVRLGLGWGMVSDLQASPAEDFAGLDPEGGIDVTLFWQQWRLGTAALGRVTQAVRQAAAAGLR
ncbi:MAG: LysR family transcriptional regulator ArgP [Streptosporangiaceae bacterium]